MLAGLTGRRSQVLVVEDHAPLRKPIVALLAGAGKVVGFDAGADDCLVKPFVGQELPARVHALLRRRTLGPGHLLRVGTLQVDHRLWNDEAPDFDPLRSRLYTAAILFASTLQDHGLAPLVGRPTGGHANQTGNMMPTQP